MSKDTRVAADSYLTLHYRIATAAGDEFLSTFDMGPATLQLGAGQLVDTLEALLIGLPAGERFVFHLEAGQAFGESNPRLIERIARGALPESEGLKENALVEFTAPNGAAFSGFVRELNAESAVIDFNHPLAGKSICFEVEIIGIL